jgi:hypothetical protein
MVARYYHAGGIFVMTQVVVANDRYAVVLQVGGSDRENEIVSLVRQLALLADRRISSP